MISSNRSHGSGFLHLFHMEIDKELLEIGLFKFFTTLGRHLIDISLVYFLYVQLEYELWQVFLFYFFWCLAYSIVVPFISQFIRRLGIKHAMALQCWGGAIFWVCMPMVLSGESFWVDLAKATPLFLLRASAKSVAEISSDILMMKHLDRKKGKTIAWLQIAIVLGSMLAPIVGALITVSFGIAYTSYVAILFFMLAGGVLMLTPDKKFKIPYSPRKLLKDSVKKKSLGLFRGIFGYVFYNGLMWVLWPVFLLVVIQDLVSLSMLMGTASFMAMMVAFFTGKSIDKANGEANKMLDKAICRSVIINAIRPFGASAIVLGGIEALGKINDQAILTSLQVKVYDWVQKKNTIERINLRWIYEKNSYTICTGILTLVFYFFEHNWVFPFLFILGAINLVNIRALNTLK